MTTDTTIQIGATIITEPHPGLFHLLVDGRLKETITATDANAICEKLVELSDGRKIVKVAMERKGVPIEIEKGVVELFMKHERLSEVLIAEAFVVESLATRIMMGAYLRMKVRDRAVKAFKSEGDAVNWVKRYLPKR